MRGLNKLCCARVITAKDAFVRKIQSDHHNSVSMSIPSPAPGVLVVLTPELLAPTLLSVAEERGRWQTFGEKTIYDNRWVRLGLVDVEAPNGERWDYHVVHLGRIAVALIVDSQDRALMLWRYRFVTEQWGYELLGGLVDAGEDAAGTAAREAEEESGWRPVGEPERLVSFEPLPGQVTAPVDVFLWRGAERIGEPTDTEEAGRVEWIPLSRVMELAQRGELLGSGTLIALLYYLASRGSATAAG